MPLLDYLKVIQGNITEDYLDKKKIKYKDIKLTWTVWLWMAFASYNMQVKNTCIERRIYL